MITKTTMMAAALMFCAAESYAQRPDTLWVKADNRFTENKFIPMNHTDSIEFMFRHMYFHQEEGQPLQRLTRSYSTYLPSDLSAAFVFKNPGRILYKPSTYSNVNYMNDDSQWSFKRSKESEHFVVFWEKGFGNSPQTSSKSFSPTTMVNDGEKIWKCYVEELGFLKPGRSTTDKYKIEMYVFYSDDWIANGSGVDGKVGLLNVTPWAVNSRGGATVAHEIGHTFQYLVSCDLGMNHGFNYGYGDNASGGNGWWESCANWQAYKVYPEMQFSDGENFEGHLPLHHLNLLHEDWRYQNCFIQDWWCMLHGKDFIGRLWRESNRPEDPVEAYKRINGLTQDEFNDELCLGYMHMATWDIDGVRSYAKHRIGSHQTHLHKAAGQTDTWEVDEAYCPQNYGYNIINMNNAAPDTVVKAYFNGIAGASGYRNINRDKAGWRYGFVAYTSDEQTVYSEMGKDKEGVLEFTIPEKCQRLFFVVMGAPTEHWRHPWDDNNSNDEQWPYQVSFENTDVYGNFGDYPEDYQPKDTTVTINAELDYNASYYTSVRVQYDMGAVSQAFGLSSDQLKKVGRTASSNPRFVGVSRNGSITTGTTTSTSSNTVFGHWFTTTGTVCGYDNSAAIFAEFYPDSYTCAIGQYPGRLRALNSYTVRQAIQYTKDGKQYTATFIVNLKVK